MLATIATRLKAWKLSILNLLFPRGCLECGTRDVLICTSCLRSVPPPNLNLPDWIQALFSYKHPLIRTSIWRLKYNYTYELGILFGRALYDALIVDISDERVFQNLPMYLVPIPITTKRRHERGYNQAELLTREILRNDSGQIFKDGSQFLGRKEMKIRQSHTKNKSERLANIQNSFFLKCPLPVHAHFIIIDDVVTTGATLEEARRILQEAGAEKVTAYTIAH